jgi:lysophospholipase L1-like esterase
VFPIPEQGARDMSFRMIVKPDVWGTRARIRLSNVFGTKPVTFDGAFVGLQESGSAVVAGTNRAITFKGKPGITVAPGQSVISDPVALPFVRSPSDPMLKGRKLAVSFHVTGESGPITWHAKSLVTSYLTAPGAGSKGGEVAETAFPYSTTSWYFLDELDMFTGDKTTAIVAFGDSITDGTMTTLNGDDRWSDVLSRRLHARFGEEFAVVNQGIGGNRVATPLDYSATNAIPGGPPAILRLERDIIRLPGVKTVIWLEGINDFGAGNATVASVIEGYTKGVEELRKRIPGVRIFVGTLTTALNSTITSHGRPEVEAKRKELNAFFKSSKLFDGVIDFDAVSLDEKTGELKPEIVPNTSVGGPGDKLHPNRYGYALMGQAIDLDLITGRKKPR